MSSLSLNTNILSLNSQRQVSKHTANLRSNFVRLSSGLRINSASDDAAGLSIATKLDTDARVSSQGLRNLNDGISLINILEGATNELSNILIRVKELAEQSANGVYSNKQRQELSKEAEALKLEYQRILNSTSFNNIDLFGSSSASLSLQAGYGIESSLNIGLGRAGAYIEEVNKGVPGTFGTPYDISADGRYILISSSDNQIYRKDTISGEVLLASSSSAGVAGNSSNTNGYISADGRYVLFEAFSSNLIVGDSNAGYDIFRKDLLTNETILVSKNKEGVQGSGVHRSMGFSADGRYATFTSSATNLIDGDTNGVTDVFRKDLVTGEVLRVNTSSDGVQQGVGITGGGAISDDGQYVLFFSAATNLVDSDTNGGNYDIFRKNFQTGKTDIVSTTFGGNQITPVETPLRSLAISGDGRYAFFESSSASVTAGDTNGVVDIFRKDLLSGEVIRVSEGANGLQANGSSTNSSVSSDGRYVLFQSNASNLVASDTNGASDLFMKDLSTGLIALVSRSESGAQGSGLNTGVRAVLSDDGTKAAFHAHNSTNYIDGETTATQQTFSTANPLFFFEKSINPLSGLSIASQGSARIALDIVSKFQQELGGFTGKLGAYASRTSTAYSNLVTQKLNYTEASSRIKDVDVASESALLVKNKILQETSTTLLKQANLQTELALNLLNNL